MKRFASLASVPSRHLALSTTRRTSTQEDGNRPDMPGARFGRPGGWRHRGAIVVMRFLFGAAILLAASTPSVAAQVEGYPNRLVRLVVPSSPGGGIDFVARITGPHLTARWQHQVVIDNRAGAGGIIGTDIVAKAAPDGHTLLIVASDFAANPFLYDKLPYATPQDFAPITILGVAPMVLVAHPSVAVKTVKDLLAAAKEKPGQLTCASAGVGSSGHLFVMILRHQVGLDLVHVPYKGAGAAAAAVVSGEVQFLATSTGATVPHIKAGTVRPIAIASSKRVSILPDLPTFAESGVPGYEVAIWFALMAPGKTPKAVIDKIYADVLEVLKVPEYAAQMKAAGYELGGMAPAEFARYINSEMKKLQVAIKEAGIRVER